MQARTSTIFQKSIRSVDSARVLKPGGNNGKLGKRVSKGPWKGKAMYSVTLVERETCPRSCHHWDDCYGNNMPFAHRFAVEGLEEKLEQEIGELLEKRSNKSGIVVRLHVLGDFFSVSYVLFWERMLAKYPTLCIFGYTAREEGTDIGDAIIAMNILHSRRCVIRSSRNKEQGDGLFSYAADESFEGASFDCPEQTGKVDSCASCGLCWQTTKTVRFATH